VPEIERYVALRGVITRIEMDKTRERVGNLIRDLYQHNESARAFFDRAAERKNDVAETFIQRIAQMADVSHYEAVRLARLLEDAGCGKLIVGRKGGRTRFRWYYGLPALGKVARNEPEATLQDVDPDVMEDQRGGATAADDEPATRSGLTIAEAKRRLAESLGITPDKIEIHIRA
jgi:hypothetical protein